MGFGHSNESDSYALKSVNILRNKNDVADGEEPQ